AYGEGDTEAGFDDFARAIAGSLIDACQWHQRPQPELAVHPGRTIVGPSALALYRVGAVKEIPGVRRYVSVDGGMADNIRPALYGARYTAALANRSGAGPTAPVTIAGKYCESGDLLLEGIELPELAPGDLLA